MFLGLLVAMKEDSENILKQEQDLLEGLAMRRVRTAEGVIDPVKAKTLSPLTAYCQAVKLTKQGWVNILVREGEGSQIYKILSEAFTREGELTYEGPPPKPIHKEIKMAIQSMYKGRGRR